MVWTTLARSGPRRAGLGAGRPSRRRIAVALAAAVWVGMAAALAPPGPARADGQAVVITDVLNVRSGPGTWATIVGHLYYQDWVWVADGPTADGWYRVAYDNGGGWVDGEYLSLAGAAPAAPAGVDQSGGLSDNVGGVVAGGGASYTAWVETDSLNLRTGPSLDAPAVNAAGYGEALTVVGSGHNGWLPIEYGGGRYWVWAGLLRFDGPPAASTHWIDVNRTTQTVTLYDGDTPVAAFWGAMGFDHSDQGFYATASGTYYVYSKYRGLSWTNWGQVYIADWVGFDPYRQNGFHTYSLDANGNVLPNGAGPTGGCIALAPSAADYLFDFAPLGTRVEIHW